jgi:UDP-N-acetylmuramate dehydrogenase
VDVTIIRNVSLVPYNTLRLESTASLMAFPHTEDGLFGLITEYLHTKKIVIIGKGANILLSRRYYDESVLFISLKMMNNIRLIDDNIQAECGATLSELTWYSIENSIEGFEFLEDIPGTIGGAILMNAGTYKDYISQLVISVRYIDLGLGEIVERTVGESDFSRRNSFWMNNDSILVSCKFKANKGDYIESLEKVINVKRNRFLKQPRNFPNAGSVFVRPKKDLGDLVVWELIDKVGLRGYRHNGASFSEKHPGFIVNNGDAKYEDIMYLIYTAQKRVKDMFDVDLTVEWRTI